MPHPGRVLWDGIVRAARRLDAFTLRTFDPVRRTPGRL